MGGGVAWLISVPGRIGKVKKLFGGEGQSYKLITCALPDLIQSLLQLVFSHIMYATKGERRNTPQKSEGGLYTPTTPRDDGWPIGDYRGLVCALALSG